MADLDPAGNLEGAPGNYTLWGSAIVGPDGDYVNNSDRIFGWFTGELITGDLYHDNSDHPGDDLIFGGDGNDRIYGDCGFLFTPLPADYVEEGGNDSLSGDGGDDQVFGMAGDDWVFGGDGNDDLIGGFGRDRVSGDAGDDTLSADRWHGRLYPGDLAYGDWLSGGTGNDLLYGGIGDDSMEGGSGNDSLLGDLGNDTLLGGDGDDTLLGGGGCDTLDGGAGADQIWTDLRGDDQRPEDATLWNLASGGEGADIIHGGAGRDSVQGDAGDDRLFGGAGDDSLTGGAGRDIGHGGAGNDTLAGEVLYGDAGNDRLTAEGAALLYGGAGNDVLAGGAGDDRLVGGTGIDSLVASAGNDVYWVDDYDDMIVNANVDPGHDLVRATIDRTLGGGQEDLLLITGERTHYGSGNAGDNLITVQGGSWSGIKGLAGDDTLIGGQGSDTLSGGQGDDRLLGMGGSDRLIGRDGADLFVFTKASDSGLLGSWEGCDLIQDFDAAEGDRIDLHLLDGDPARPGDQTLTYIGSAGFSGRAGELRVDLKSWASLVSIDVDGDGRVDFMLRLENRAALDENSFIL